MKYFIKAIGRKSINPIIYKRLFKYDIEKQLIENYPNFKKSKNMNYEIPDKFKHLIINHTIKKEESIFNSHNFNIISKSLKKDILKLAQPLFYSTVDDDYFEKLSKHKDCFLRSLIAIHPESSKFILNKLSNDEDFFVKYLVSFNKNTPIELIYKICNLNNDIKKSVLFDKSMWLIKQALLSNRFGKDDELFLIKKK